MGYGKFVSFNLELGLVHFNFFHEDLLASEAEGLTIIPSLRCLFYHSTCMGMIRTVGAFW